MNEIVKYGRNEEEHDRFLPAILLRLAEYGVGLNYGECNVAVTELDFIDYVISGEGRNYAVDRMKVMKWRNHEDKTGTEILVP